MKKTILSAAALVLLVLLTFSGCSKNGSQNKAAYSIVCANFPCYDAVRAVTRGLSADLHLLVKPGAEVHSYDPSPQDIITLQNADLFVYVGGESDQWVDRILGSEKKKPPVLRLFESVTLLAEADSLEEEAEDHSSDEIFLDESDEHIWTSPANEKAIIMAVKEAVQKACPDLDKAQIAENAANYCEKIQKTDEKIRSVLDKASDPFIVMADRFPLVYFADYYNVEYLAAFSGCSTAVESTPATIAALIDAVGEKKLPAVFYIELGNHKLADVVAESTGTKALLLQSVQNVTKADFDAGETWVSLMERNAKALEEGLAE